MSRATPPPAQVLQTRCPLPLQPRQGGPERVGGGRAVPAALASSAPPSLPLLSPSAAAASAASAAA